ncbi:FAD binding domain-containing protein [Coprinopsis sp. MPI-PUGE-AT-0042]|nr:FAD binding domain-containing protein [Coprinopsis sp. MPI-PUGE-AT-0042]
MDVSSLAKAIKGDVVTPDQPTYADAIKRWAKNAERRAAVVVFVKDEEDLAASIKFAKEHKLKFAIRGGGHNAAGASSAEEGLVVDLGKYLKQVRVDAEAKLAYIGGGAIWKDVDEEAIKYGLATVGGTVNHTGVGGLTLGGGLGWLSGRYGLASDNLRRATVVTADGSILRLQLDTENQDLFWGIRGGGSNFGVVTEFVLQLYPQRKTVYAGSIVYTMDNAEKVVNATQEWWLNIKEDEGMSQAATFHNGMPLFIACVFYNGSEAEGRERFKAFLDIEHIVDGTKEIPYEALNALQNAIVEPGLCYYLTGTAQKDPSMSSTLEVMKKLVEIAPEGFTPAVLAEYFPLEKINSVPTTETAFRRERKTYIVTIISWPNSEGEDKTARARAIARELDIILSKGQGISESTKLGYANYDMDHGAGDKESPAFDVKARQAFAGNYTRLQKLKKQYDPEVFFDRWFPIAPA